ncbi:MAG: transglycosylase SLT domain-containing protein [Bacteroidia bacterium]|nr:transglycosylase SLT domain-containing protein [Bacteroidia bacterium]
MIRPGSIREIVLGAVFSLLSLPCLSQSAPGFQDDPIAAMLDSLVQLNIFEKTGKPLSGAAKYNYAPDSVPRFSDAIIAQRLSRLDATSPFDMVYNDQVKGYIEMYAYRKRQLMAKVLGLSELYFPLFEETLDKYNMPLELKYLAVIESALNPNAKSRAGAMGLWQFMYGTGKLYGLKVTSYLDERCDPRLATEAACQYLQFLYETFGDWQMALAAYNCGPGNINKAIRRSGGKKTYWEVRPYLPKETQGYVPSFIAVTYVMNYAAEHNLSTLSPKKGFFQIDTVHIKQTVSFAQVSAVLDIPVEDLVYLNPVYKRNHIPVLPGQTMVLTLPVSRVGSFINNESSIYKYIKEDSVLAGMITKEVQKTHTVKSGEKINSIANRYKCTVADIMTWNGLTSYKLKPGQKLTIYVPAKGTAPAPSPVVSNKKPIAPKDKTVAVNTAPGDGKYKYHIIRNGDNLWTLAQKYGTTVENLKQLNGFGKKYSLVPGQKIKIGSEKG